MAHLELHGASIAPGRRVEIGRIRSALFATSALAVGAATGAATSALGVPFFLAIRVGQKQRAALWGRG